MDYCDLRHVVDSAGIGREYPQCLQLIIAIAITLAPTRILEPSGRGTSCMTLALIAWPDLAFFEFSEEFNWRGSIVPDGIGFCASSLIEEASAKAINSVRFIFVTSTWISRIASVALKS